MFSRWYCVCSEMRVFLAPTLTSPNQSARFVPTTRQSRGKVKIDEYKMFLFGLNSR